VPKTQRTDTRPEVPETERDLRDAREYRILARIRIEHTVSVREPLVLVSQVERSGGTLLSRLFDDHPECHAHPRDIEIGYPKKNRHWPPIDLDQSESWFEMLHEAHVGKYRRNGQWSLKRVAERVPFLFSLELQRTIFETWAANQDVSSRRDVLDCYFTSYFNAWLDNHNLYTGPKKVVTGFVPRLTFDLTQVERFFMDYPDGTLVTTVRNPCGWYLSFRDDRRGHDDVEGALGLWRRSAMSALEAQERRPERVVVVLYEDLVRDTEATMRRLATRIGITMSPALLVPTFNGRSIAANSSSNVKGEGVLPERADAWRNSLDKATTTRIEALADGLYERAQSVAQS
jgi:Sulfotransferase family